MPHSTFIPRDKRGRKRFDREFNRLRAAGSKVIEAAEIGIAAAFNDNFQRINDRKLTLERNMRGGVNDRMVRAIFGRIAMACPANLAGAIREIERNYRAEQRDERFRLSHGLPYSRQPTQEVLQRARIFLRWYRRYADQDRYPFFWLHDALTTSPAYRVEAAE
jgi:hypothetical protein